MFPSPFARLFGIKSASFANEQWSHGLQHLWHKRRNARFKGLRRIHTPSPPLTAHTAAHRAKQGRFERGWYHYPQTVLCGSETLRGRVSERQTLPLLGLGRGYSRRTQRAFGTAMCLCASLSRGIAAPLGCATLMLLLRFALREALQAVAETAENTYPPRTVRI